MQDPEPPPVAKLKLGAKLLLERLVPPPLKVGVNIFGDAATQPSCATVIGANVAPGGTVTVSWLVLAVSTEARTAPKYTVLAAAVELKLLPVIVTRVPIDPVVGEIVVMAGTSAPWALHFPALSAL